MSLFLRPSSTPFHLLRSIWHPASASSTDESVFILSRTVHVPCDLGPFQLVAIAWLGLVLWTFSVHLGS